MVDKPTPTKKTARNDLNETVMDVIDRPSIESFVIRTPIKATLPKLNRDQVWWKEASRKERRDFGASGVLIEEDEITLMDERKVTYVRREQWDSKKGRRKKQFYIRDGGNYRSVNEVPIEEWPLFNSENIDSSKPIVVVEGLKTAKSLIDRGIKNTVGTFSAQISAKALKPLFKGELLLWPDNDEAGVNLMMNIARITMAEKANVRLLKWVDGPYHGDAADYDEDLDNFLKSAEPIDPELISSTNSTPKVANVLAPTSISSRRAKLSMQGGQ